ncbi:hypothetical protein ABE10_00715, partial [Bacillus toyonensis]|nr:hypothetical protein [Bacillus toyonensis]
PVARAARLVDDEIARDGEHPGAHHARVVVQDVLVLPGAEEDLLGDVVRVIAVPGASDDMTQDRRVVAG